MRSDSDIERDVEAELRWDPDINATDIGVAVKGGVVTLTGFVRSYLQKWDAELAAKRVAGVAGVANDLDIRLPDERSDPDIARDAVAAITSRVPEASDRIRVIVEDGVVTLEGEVEWHYQRERAERVVRRLRGVKDVINSIDLKPQAPPVEIKRKIEDALRRNAALDAERITVEVNGSAAILTGTVRSWAERREAERIAWAAPGITKVDNRLVVTSSADVAIGAKGYRASVLMGREVLNHRSERIGTIDDIIISRERVCLAVLQIGGFLGLGGHLVAIPFQDLVLEDLDANAVRVTLPGATKDALKKLPEFKYGG